MREPGHLDIFLKISYLRFDSSAGGKKSPLSSPWAAGKVTTRRKNGETPP
jgi:hypothetical protein